MLRQALLVLGTVIALAAQTPFAFRQDAEPLFRQGLALYREHSYLEAAVLFDSLARLTPVHQRTTASFVMEGKAQFAAGRYRESAEHLVAFLKAYPQTNY